MNPQTHTSILVFRNRERRFGLMLDQVREVLPAFEITATPGIAEKYVGLISLRGEVLPVLDAARFSNDTATKLRPQHQFVIARSGSQTVAVLVEDIVDLVERDNVVLERREFLENGVTGMQGVFLHEGEMVMLVNLDEMLPNPSKESATLMVDETELLAGEG